MFATIEKVRDVILDKKYRWFETGFYNLNIIGVRSTTSESNKFDDRLLVIFRDRNSQMVMKEYPITTDPGKPWLLKPMDPGGTAVMVPGQYPGAYMIGIHGRSKPASRRYKALEQCGKIAYVRDNNRDSLIDTSLYKDPTKVFWGILKTNIHRSSRFTLQRMVETYSAGCQVFQDPKQFDEFMDICEKARDLHDNRFTYTLLEEADFGFLDKIAA